MEIKDCNTRSHEIKLIDRSVISLSGIKKIVNFDKEEFFLECDYGKVQIKGNDLELLRLDTVDGIVKIKGRINSIVYIDNKKNLNAESFWVKLFK